jgi:ribose 5-phosphate isomerase B
MIYLGSDHGGFNLKEKIKKWLTQWGYAWEDMGNTFYDKDDDYPKFAFLVAKKVVEEEKNTGKVYPTPWKDRPKGILCCRSAAGMVIAANKVKGARAVVCFDPSYVRHSRLHNDSNILALGADWLDDLQVKKIIKTWLETEFSGEARHVKRLGQISAYENS